MGLISNFSGFRACAPLIAFALLTGCGGSESDFGKAEPPGEPVRVEECSAKIRAQLDTPESFQIRMVEDVRLSWRRSTRIVFAATAPDRSGEPGPVTVCQATYRH